MSKDYKVGYKRPPKFSQFRKGKSGNPMGRPRDSKSLKRAMIDESNTKLDIKDNGEIKRLTKMEAFVKRLWNDALNGDARAMAQVLKYCDRFDHEDADEMEPRPLTEDEQRYYFSKMAHTIAGVLKQKKEEQKRSETEAEEPTVPDDDEF